MHWPAQSSHEGFEAEYPAVAPPEQMQALHATQAASPFQNEMPSPSGHLSVVESSVPKAVSIYSPQVGSIYSPPTFGARVYSPQVGSCSEGKIQKQLEQMEHARCREMVAHNSVPQPYNRCLVDRTNGVGVKHMLLCPSHRPWRSEQQYLG